MMKDKKRDNMRAVSGVRRPTQRGHDDWQQIEDSKPQDMMTERQMMNHS